MDVHSHHYGILGAIAGTAWIVFFLAAQTGQRWKHLRFAIAAIGGSGIISGLLAVGAGSWMSQGFWLYASKIAEGAGVALACFGIGALGMLFSPLNRLRGHMAGGILASTLIYLSTETEIAGQDIIAMMASIQLTAAVTFGAICLLFIAVEQSKARPDLLVYHRAGDVSESEREQPSQATMMGASGPVAGRGERMSSEEDLASTPSLTDFALHSSRTPANGQAFSTAHEQQGGEGAVNRLGESPRLAARSGADHTRLLAFAAIGATLSCILVLASAAMSSDRLFYTMSSGTTFRWMVVPGVLGAVLGTAIGVVLPAAPRR